MERITVSLPDEVAAAVREHAGPGGVSAFIAKATQAQLDAERSLAAFRAHTGVVPTVEEDEAAAAFFGDAPAARKAS